MPWGKPDTCKVMTQPEGIIIFPCEEPVEFPIETNAQVLDHVFPDFNLDTNAKNYISTTGCYCSRIYNGITSPVGKPRNVVDNICKHWQNCMKCNGLKNDCDMAKEGGYSLQFIEKSYQCISGKDECSNSRCQCDLNFAKELAEVLSSKGFPSLSEDENASLSDEQCKETKKQSTGIESPRGGDKGGNFGSVFKQAGDSLASSGESLEVIVPEEACCGTHAPSWKIYHKNQDCCLVESDGSPDVVFGERC